METIEINEKCGACSGTGLFSGMAERDGAAVVCHKCQGTGCHKFKHNYELFEKREENTQVRRVFQTNPGICIGEGGDFRLEDFGGVPASEWSPEMVFPKGTENRRHTCPAWWYQSADYSKKPKWGECMACGAFPGCSRFSKKEECWKKFDQEQS